MAGKSTATPLELIQLAAELPAFIGRPQAAKLIGYSVRSLDRDIEAGRLALYRIGRGRVLRVRTADVLALVERVA